MLFTAFTKLILSQIYLGDDLCSRESLPEAVPKSKTAIKFGRAIRPLKISEMPQTSESDDTEPKNTQSTKVALYMPECRGKIYIQAL